MLGYNKGILIEKSTVQRIVRNLGYSRQKNRKMEQVGNPDPDRGVQFVLEYKETVYYGYFEIIE